MSNKHFKMQTSILGNAGQFWNFAAMLGCGAMAHLKTPSSAYGAVRAQLPGSNLWVCYTEFPLRDQSVFDTLRNNYSGSTSFTQAAPFLSHHLNIEMTAEDEGRVLQMLTKDGGACVIMKSHIQEQFGYAIEIFRSHAAPYSVK